MANLMLARPARRTRKDGIVDQVLPGPGKFIDDKTGQVMFTAGENGPEGVRLLPMKGVSTRNPAAPGSSVPGYADGTQGRIDVNGNPVPDDGAYDANGNRIPSGPVVSVSSQAAGGGDVQPAGSYGQGGTQQWQANQQLLNATGADIQAGRNIQQATSGQIGAGYNTVAATNADIAANRGVIPYENTQLAAERGALNANNQYLGVQSQNNAASRSEELAQEAAARNVDDITAVARAQRVNQNQDQLYGLFGLSKPIDVTLPAGTRNVAAPGVRTAPQTQQQLLAGLAKEQSTLRGFNSEDSRIAAAQAGNTAQSAAYDTTGAKIRAEGAGLDVQQAQSAERAAGLNVQTASNAERWTSMDVRAAQLAKGAADQPPNPGDVLDPFSGNWVSQAQNREIQREQRVNFDPVNQTYVTNEELQATTDAAGNRLRTSDGVWVSKQGNELVNGVWTDPRTGDGSAGTRNYYDPNQKAWVDPVSNNKFVITNPRTGAGYWQSPQGFVLQSDGVWLDQKSGKRYIVQGGVLVPEDKRGAAAGTNAPAPGVQFGP